ncbi:MAG: OadG family protein [Acidobacteriota bacterium]
MEISPVLQGLEITIIGILMVFAGLILTFVMINLFSVIPSVLKKIQKKSSGNREKNINLSEHSIPDDHLAVIAAVLNIEKKLKVLKEQGRFTFRD